MKFKQGRDPMSVGFKMKALLVVFLALSTAAVARPAHLLFHAGKKASYPARHIKKSSHEIWRLLKEVF